MRLFREERYETLSATRIRAVSFLLGTFLVAAATTNAPIGGPEYLDEGLHLVVWVGLLLTGMGVLVATVGTIALTRAATAQLLGPWFADEARHQTTDDFYRTMVRSYDYAAAVNLILRRWRWQRVIVTGVVFAVLGGLLTWSGALLL